MTVSSKKATAEGHEVVKDVIARDVVMPTI